MLVFHRNIHIKIFTVNINSKAMKAHAAYFTVQCVTGPQILSTCKEVTLSIYFLCNYIGYYERERERERSVVSY
jgi:hypothetical protein